MSAATAEPVREKSLQEYRKKLIEHKEVESRLKESKFKIFFRLGFKLHYHSLQKNPKTMTFMRLTEIQESQKIKIIYL